MRYTTSEKENIIHKNRHEYGNLSRFMEFVDDAGVMELTRLRDEWVARLNRLGVEYGANGTKLDLRGLSPGCQICMAGRWSCLFVNNLCNARCFYCPSSQDDLSEPATNHLTFDDAGFHACYLKRFGFTGAAISGGEPFMSFERTLDYITRIREVNGNGFHIWMYTNGILSSPEKLRRLVAAGLNELRFDLTAVGYRVDQAARAVGVIETVAVEVPAIEGEISQLKKMAAGLAAAGVGHLNLHQLRCTPYSAARMIERGISFIHAPFVLSAWSEVIALEVMASALESGLDLPVHFCSFLYKYHNQNCAARRRAAGLLQESIHSVTPAGYLREITSDGVALDALQVRGRPFERLRLDYFESRISQTREDGGAEVFSWADRVLHVHKRRAQNPILLEGREVGLFTEAFLNDFPWNRDMDPDEQLHTHGDSSGKFSAIRAMEVLPEGLIEYF